MMVQGEYLLAAKRICSWERCKFS